MKKNVKKSIQKSVEANKKPLLIGAIVAGVAAIGVGIVKGIRSMKASAKAQHAVDKAEFEAVKAESRANFEENRAHNTFAKAKADAKQHWDDAHMSSSERAALDQEAREARLAEAEARIEEANARYEAAKKN